MAEPFLHFLKAQLFHQSILPGEEVGPQSQTVSFDRYAHGRQSRGKQIQSTVFSAPAGICRLHSGIDDCAVGLPCICRIDGITEIRIHGGMIAAQDNCRILIKILFLDPVD